MMKKVKSQTKGVSRKVICICLFCLIVVATVLGLSVSPDAVDTMSTTLAKSVNFPQVIVNETYRRLPLIFEVNVGQTDKKVKFFSRGRGSTLFLTSTEAVLVIASMRDSKVGMQNE